MLIYILKSAACLAILLVFYKLFLEKENMHVFKRFYLLGSLLFALLVPTIVFSEYVIVEPPAVETQSFIGPQSSEIVVAEPNIPPKLESDITDIAPLLWIVYLLGMLFFGIKFLKNLFQIYLRIRRNPKYKKSSFIQVLLQEKIPPHTFFKYIFLNRSKFESKEIPKEVILHEETHARQKHSLDVVFIELLQVIFWVNPLIYFFKKAIKLNHEFLADSAVLNKDVDAVTYQNTLLSFLSSESAKKYQPTLPNAINYSSIKKRFTIMKSKTSKKSIVFRSFLLLPLLALLLAGFTETKMVPVVNESIERDTNNYSSITERTSTRSVELGGLILDSETLKPLESVEIYDSNGNILSKTDERGYYKVQFTDMDEGEIRFEYTLHKEGYEPVEHRERWGNLQGEIKSTYFFGLQKKESNSPEFSQYVANNKNLSYESILNNFYLVQNRYEFNKKLNIAKKGNQRILMKIDDVYYLVSDTGWININSKDDPISIDDDQIVPAFKLNNLLERKDITGMTPLGNRKALFAIYTIPVDHAVGPLKGATKEQLAKYNSLAKKYNAIPKEGRVIPLGDLKILEQVFRKMSISQKKDAQPFPECPQDGATKEQLAEYNALAKKYNAIDIEQRKIPFFELTVLELAYRKMNPGQRKIAQPFPECLPQEGAMKVQLQEYNTLAKKYNTMIDQDQNIWLKKGDIDRLEYLHSLMSEEQRENAEPYPDFPEPPEPPMPPNSPDEEKIIEMEREMVRQEKAMQEQEGAMIEQEHAMKEQERAMEEQEIEMERLGRYSHFPAPPNLAYRVDQKPLTKELKKLVDNFGKKRKLYQNAVKDYLNNGRGNENKIYGMYENLMEAYDEYKVMATDEGVFAQPVPAFAPKVRKGETSNIPPPPTVLNVPVTPKSAKNRLSEDLKNKNSSGELTEVPEIPKQLAGSPSPPPTPESPLDHVIKMAKKNAVFYFEGKKISSDKAIEIIKNNKEINIHSTGSKSKRPEVKLSTAPIVID